MTTELTPLDSLKHFNLVENGLIVTGQPSYDEWQTAFYWLKRIDRAAPWIIGDLLAYGEMAYSEMYAQVFDPDEDDEDNTHFKKGTLYQYKFVAKRWPISIRIKELPWSYHQVTASLSIEQRISLMQHCLENGIKRPELADNVKELNNGKHPNPPTRPADRQFELETENHRLQQRVTELEQAVIMPELGETIPPDDLPTYATRALGDLENALIEFNYSSVTVYQDGSVTWHK